MHAFIDCRKSIFNTNHASAHNYVKLQVSCDILHVFICDGVCMHVRTYVGT